MASPRLTVRVQAEDFDPGAELAALPAHDLAVGGLGCFIGLVRADDGAAAMTLEHYPGMTEAAIRRIVDHAAERWPLSAVTVIHRYGRLTAGARIVFVGTASAHRAAALESCAFLIDWLKTKAPFWKKEETADGARWVTAKAEDDAAAARWRTTAL